MTTEADCVRALREAARRLGESPTKAQYEALGLTPASGTIQRVMGSWNDAKAAAGLATNASTGSRVEPKPDDVSLPERLAWDGTDKEMTISEMVTHGYSKGKIRAEMAKCDLLCANCHRKNHYQVPEHSRSVDDTVGNDDE